MKNQVSTIHYIIKISKTEEIVTNKHPTGRLKKLTNREKEIIIRKIKKDRNILAMKLTQIVANYFGKNVHAELCHRILRNNDLHGRVPTKYTLIR